MYHHLGAANPRCHEILLLSFPVKHPGTENPENEKSKGNEVEQDISSRDTFRALNYEYLTGRCPSEDKKLLKPMTKDAMVDGLNIA